VFIDQSDLRVQPSGRFPGSANPGLKPWAVLYSRFAAKSTSSLSLIVGLSSLILGRFAYLIEQRSQDYGHN
jgi:hypothetical protein